MNVNLLIELNDFLVKNNLTLNSSDFDFMTDITWKTTLPIKCNRCGEEFEITTKQLIRPHPERTGFVCSRCNAEDLFIKKLELTYGENPYEFISEFKGYNELLKVKCKDCGYEWTVKAARNLLMGKNLPDGAHPCKQCAINRNYKQDIENFKQKLIDKFGVCNYDFLSDNYTGTYSKSKIHVRCKICGSEFTVNPQNLLNPKNGKHYCKSCNKRGRNAKNK